MIRQKFLCPGCGGPKWLCDEEALFCDTCGTKLTWKYFSGKFTLTATGQHHKCEEAREKAAMKEDCDATDSPDSP